MEIDRFNKEKELREQDEKISNQKMQTQLRELESQKVAREHKVI